MFPIYSRYALKVSIGGFICTYCYIYVEELSVPANDHATTPRTYFVGGIE